MTEHHHSGRTSELQGKGLVKRRETGPSVKSLLWTGTATVLGRRAALPASMLTTDRRIFSTLCTGLQRSALLVAHGVVSQDVQDGDADSAIWVDCRAGHTVSRGTLVTGPTGTGRTMEKRHEQWLLKGAVCTATQPWPGRHTNIHTPPTGPASSQGTARSRTVLGRPAQLVPVGVAPFSYGFYRYYIRG